MTLEEAGQIVLEGNAFRPCKECAGEGRVLIEFRTDHERGKPAMEVETYQLCRPCEHTGQIVRDEYRLACRLLSTKVPTPPPRQRRLPGHTDEVVQGSVPSPMKWFV